MTFIRTVFLARVPIFFLLVVTLLPGLSLPFSPLVPVIQGLFSLDDATSLFLVTLVAFLVSLGATASINLILEHGSERMSADVNIPDTNLPYRPSLWLYLLCQLPALFFVVRLTVSPPISWFVHVATIVAAWLVAHLFLVIAIGIEILLSNPNAKVPNMLVIPFPVAWEDKAQALLVYDPLPFTRHIADAFAGLLARYALPILPGYFYLEKGKYKFYSGMVSNTVFSALMALLWFAVIALVASEKHHAYASLAFVLLALLLLMLLFSGVAFFFDRFRIPLSLALLAYVALVGTSPSTDHLYRVEKKAVTDFASPADVLKAHQHPVIIMTAGGGIQAAAWTTQIFAGMDALTQNEFRKQVALISSVSGGSLGAYYAAVSYHRRQPSFEEARQWALKPALDEVAWAWFGPDLMRTFLPYAWRTEVDRGWALEKAWEATTGERDFFLDDLAEDTRLQRAPAFIMNATIIEEGSPFVFYSSHFQRRHDSRASLRDVKEFNREYKNQLRVRVATAARLSASFPYVAPTARSNAHPLLPDYHLVDGGYYDNFGILSALDWLEMAMPDGTPKPEKIALVQIRWGTVADTGGSIHGWGYQTNAPLSAIISVREKEQLREDRAALQSFLKNWQGQVEQFEFVYDGADPCDKQPNSWKLTADQQACITSVWSSQQATAQKLAEFLK